jgi:hypothetical protein
MIRKHMASVGSERLRNNPEQGLSQEGYFVTDDARAPRQEEYPVARSAPAKLQSPAVPTEVLPVNHPWSFQGNKINFSF